MDKSISDLIYESFTGNLSPEGRDALDRWLAVPGNREFYDRIRDRKLILRKAERFDRYNASEAWDTLNRRMHSKRTRMKRRTAWRYAAAVFIPALLLSGAFLLLRNPAPGPDIEVSHIAPGGQLAMVVMPDGEMHNLYKDSTYSFVSEDGMLVKSVDGEVSFEVTETAANAVASNHTVTTPRGGEFRVVLPDRSVVWLNAESSLVFPSRFDGGQRKVQLTGEAYFDVEKDLLPFIVEVDGVEVEVLGTEFNVRSYDGLPLAVTLVEGAVELASGQVRTPLAPGQQGVLLAGGMFDVRDADTYAATAWKNGYFYFDASSLEDIMTELARWYDITAYFENEELKRERFTIETPREEDFAAVIRLLEQTGSVSVSTSGKEIFVGK